MARKPWTPRRPNDAILKEKLEIMERVARATKNPPGPGSPPPTPASFGVRTEDVDRVTAALARHKEWASHTIIHAVIGWLVFAAALTASIAIIVIAGERIGPLGLLFAFAVSTLIAMAAAETVQQKVLAWKRGRNPFRWTGISPQTVALVTDFQTAEREWRELEDLLLKRWHAQAELDILLDMKRERDAARVREDHWTTLGGVEFENELGELYSRLGYEVSQTPTTGDEGIDLILRKPGELIVVQCKQHGKPAGQHFVRDLYGAMMHQRAQRAILACTAGFTDQARSFAKGKPIELLDLNGILQLAGQD